MWQVALHERTADSLHTILNEWTLADVYAAAAMLEAFDDAEARALARVAGRER